MFRMDVGFLIQGIQAVVTVALSHEVPLQSLAELRVVL